MRNVMKSVIFAGAWLAGAAHAHAAAKVGVLFSSYGDIDSPEEAEGYVKRSVLDPDVAPVPGFLRGVIANVGWELLKKNTEEEYRRIGGSTHYRAASKEQADLVEAALRKDGVDAKGYTGFVFTYPYIVDTMAKIQADGVTDLVVIDQGAQYSAATQAINLREVRKYLAQHPEWNVHVTGIKSFSEDQRFVDLVGDSIESSLARNFADVPREDVCIFLPAHGLPTSLPEHGDPAIAQMRYVIKAMADRFPSNNVSYGFQNHDEFPGSQWTQPKAEVVAKKLAKTCNNVLINGRVSFTIDNLETFFDEGVAQRELIEKLNPKAKVVVDKMFNSEPAFVDYMKVITVEALDGKGDLTVLR